VAHHCRYHQEGVPTAVADRHPEAAVILPPRATRCQAALLHRQSATVTSYASLKTAHVLVESIRPRQTLQSRGGHRPMESKYSVADGSCIDERGANQSGTAQKADGWPGDQRM
jgi:hypothetical protein